MASELNVTVTVSDPVTGETETRELLANQYIIICGENRYVSHENVYATTNVVTIKTKD